MSSFTVRTSWLIATPGPAGKCSAAHCPRDRWHEPSRFGHGVLATATYLACAHVALAKISAVRFFLRNSKRSALHLVLTQCRRMFEMVAERWPVVHRIDADAGWDSASTLLAHACDEHSFWCARRGACSRIRPSTEGQRHQLTSRLREGRGSLVGGPALGALRLRWPPECNVRVAPRLCDRICSDLSLDCGR
jgi:hypothetical protein